jgi:hypothetical protein
MKKIYILLFSFSLAIAAFAQRKLNPKIGKNETEIASFIMGDDYLAYGGQLVYRLPVMKKLKLGAGILYGANYEEFGFDPGTYGYGAVFADALLFLGHRQKWSFGAQIGHGIYNHDYHSYDYKIKAGGYYSIAANYRAIVSNKLLFTTSLFIGYRNFHDTSGYPENNTGLVGLKAGIVF